MRPDYGERYRELYQQHWWWRARQSLILRILREKQPRHGWRTILDVGCGDGLFFDELSQFGEVEGVEPAADLVSGNGPHRLRIHVAPFDRGLQLQKQFSLILMLDVLEHLSDPTSALRYALELLDPNGILLVTVPAFNLLWTNHDIINEHITRYTKPTFRSLAEQAGVRIESEQYFFHWLFLVKLVTAAAERLFRIQPVPAAIPPRWINGLLYGLSRFEQGTWGALPIPFGSSMLVVGRKGAAH